MLEGSNNTIIFDVETQQISTDCRACGLPESQCVRGYPIAANTHTFEPIGWDDKALLGLSIGCIWDYQEQRYAFFDPHTLQQTVAHWIKSQPLMVSFNGLTFDGPLLRSLLRQEAEGLRLNEYGTARSFDEAAEQSFALIDLCDDFIRLMVRGYDILQELWIADPIGKKVKGLNTLDAIAQANGMPPKASGGALIPQWWREGRYADVLEHVTDDVYKTRMLFEQVMRGEPLRRLDGSQVLLPPPLPLGGRDAYTNA